MSSLNELLGDRELVVSMPPEELAGYLLLDLIERIRHRDKPLRSSFVVGYQSHGENFCDALAEAWSCWSGKVA
jgi:hypothetical protein